MRHILSHNTDHQLTDRRYYVRIIRNDKSFGLMEEVSQNALSDML